MRNRIIRSLDGGITTHSGGVLKKIRTVDKASGLINFQIKESDFICYVVSTNLDLINIRNQILSTRQSTSQSFSKAKIKMSYDS